MGKCVERIFKKISLKPNTASHNNASWYTDTDGLLEHSPSEGNLCYEEPTLQNIILGFSGSHLVHLSQAISSFLPVAFVGPAGRFQCQSAMFLKPQITHCEKERSSRACRPSIREEWKEKPGPGSWYKPPS